MTRSPARSTATSAAAPATRRSSRRWGSWRRPGAAARCRRCSTTAASGSRSPATAPSAQALGEKPYVADMQREGLLHGALVLSPHARARVVRIDTSKAAALPGVRAVVTAADVPGERWYGLLYADWPGFVAEGEEVRCVGDVLGRGGGRRRAHGARGGGAGSRSSTSRCHRSSIPSPPSPPAPPRSTRSTRTSSRARSSAGATPRRPWPQARTSCPARGARSGSSTSSWSRRPRSRSPCRTAASGSTRRARVSSTTAGRWRSSSACRRSRSAWSSCRAAGPSGARRTCRSRPRRRSSRASRAGR